MYCRQCHYDLRALTTNRCPECGNPFDPNNPDSFYPHYPSFGWRARTALDNFSWRGAVLIFFCVTWFFVILLPASSVHSMPASKRREVQLSQGNLTSIMTHWINRQKKEPPSSSFTFDKQAALKDLPSGLSPWTEQDLIQHRRQIQYSLRAGQFWLLLFVPPLMAIALLWRGNVRRQPVCSRLFCY
jgi:hypothetical protein